MVTALVAIPVVWLSGRGGDSTGSMYGVAGAVTVTETVAEASGVRSDQMGIEPKDANSGADAVTFVENSTGSQASFYNMTTGERLGTATERFARPALSLAKLYIAEYVLSYGDEEDAFEAISMISDSDDNAATRLYEKYPDSINDIADDYHLVSTRGASRWGQSVTSTYDVVEFVAALKRSDPDHPILVAMALADPVAADGYGQDFGTAELAGVIGTKWAWSDSRTLHSSVSFGDDWVVAAAVTGDADDLTEFVEVQLADVVE